MQKPNSTQLNAAKIQKCELFPISPDYNCPELQKDHPGTMVQKVTLWERGWQSISSQKNQLQEGSKWAQ